MRITAAILLFALPGLFAQQPLTSLPYTPSLDIQAMDRSVEPCENFYLYACGTWIKDNPIPPDQARWDVYSKLTYENQLFLWGLLLAGRQYRVARAPPNQQKIGDLFHACMDEAAVEKAGAAPVAAHPAANRRPEIPERPAGFSGRPTPDALCEQHAFFLRLQPGLCQFVR